MRHFHRFIGGDARAGDAARRGRIEAVRYFYRIIGGNNALFSHAAIDAVTGIFHRTAQGFVTAVTVFAVSAAFEEPCHARAVTHFQGGHTWTNLFNNANPFMAEDHPGLVTEIAVFYVQIGVTDPTAFHGKQCFTVLQRTQLFIGDTYLMVMSDNCSLHILLLVILYSKIILIND